MTLIAIVAAAALVGFLIGAVGIGGILLVPALVGLAGHDAHMASATALFTFLFTGVVGTWLFARKGSIDWRQAGIVCAAAIVFSYLGAMTNNALDSTLLLRIIALLTLFAGLYVLLPRGGGGAHTHSPRGRVLRLALIGATAGFGSGLSGAGGPLFSVPLMLLAGFAPLASVGVSQVLQIVSAASGSLAHLVHGAIDWSLAPWIVGGEMAGIGLGVKLAHAASAGALKRLAAAMCVLVGVFLLARTYGVV